MQKEVLILYLVWKKSGIGASLIYFTIYNTELFSDCGMYTIGRIEVLQEVTCNFRL